MGGRGDRPTVENRWWVDQGKDGKGQPAPRPPATFGARFFRSGTGFDQERAQRRLTDLNLKWFEEAPGEPGSLTVVAALDRERFNAGRLERAKKALPVPRDGRGVLIDSGTSLRAIISGSPLGERLVELRLGEDNSFDAWVRGEWVHEAAFRDFEDALRRAPALVSEYVMGNRAEPLG